MVVFSWFGSWVFWHWVVTFPIFGGRCWWAVTLAIDTSLKLSQKCAFCKLHMLPYFLWQQTSISDHCLIQADQHSRLFTLALGNNFLKVDDGADPFKLFLLLWPLWKTQSFIFWFSQVLLGSILFCLDLSHPPPSLDCFSLVQRASPSQNFFMAHGSRKSGSLLRCVSLSVQHFSIFYI